MKDKLQEDAKTIENNDEENELYEYQLSYYKWGSYCFKAGFIVCALFFLRIIIGLIKF